MGKYISAYTGTQIDAAVAKLANQTLSSIDTAVTNSAKVANQSQATIDASITYTQGQQAIKKYVALLTQIGTNAPVATVLENTLGQIITPSYADVGIYNLNVAVDQFLVNKVTVIFTNGYTDTPGFIGVRRSGNKIVKISVADITGNPSDGILFQATIIINVYP